MLNEHRDLIGKTKAFDGATLFLPHRLPEQVWLLTLYRLLKFEYFILILLRL